jgi:hypothetical protein
MIRQGGTAEAAIDWVNETIDSMANHSNTLVAGWFPEGKMAEKQWHVDKNYVDSRRRDLKFLNCRFVSR